MEAERVRQLPSEDMLKHDIANKKAVEVITPPQRNKDERGMILAPLF